MKQFIDNPMIIDRPEPPPAPVHYRREEWKLEQWREKLDDLRFELDVDYPRLDGENWFEDIKALHTKLLKKVDEGLERMEGM